MMRDEQGGVGDPKPRSRRACIFFLLASARALDLAAITNILILQLESDYRCIKQIKRIHDSESDIFDSAFDANESCCPAA